MIVSLSCMSVLTIGIRAWLHAKDHVVEVCNKGRFGITPIPDVIENQLLNMVYEDEGLFAC